MSPDPLLAGEWEGRVIGAVTFDRTGDISDRDLLEIIQVNPGDRFQTRHIRSAISRLYQTGFYKNILVEAEQAKEAQVALHFILIEKQFLSSINISGNHSISEKDILNALSFQTGNPFTEARWSDLLSEVASFYQKKGFFRVKFSSHLESESEDRSKIKAFLRIDEGMPVRIRSLKLQGEKSFSDWVLALRMFSHKGELYRHHIFEEDIDRLKAFYESEGYLKATVGPAVVTYVAETNEVDIRLSVKSSNKIEIFFEGKDLFSRRHLESHVLIKEEHSDEEDVLEESARQIEGFYKRKGYPYAEVKSVSRRFPKENRLEVHFKIKSGFRAKIREVRFVGNYSFPQKRLQELIQLREESLLKKQLFTKAVLEKDAVLLSDFYKENGFQDVQVRGKGEFDSLRRSLIVVFNIDEGIRTRIENIEIVGNMALSRIELLSVLGDNSQRSYNETVVEEIKQTLLSAYSRKGYLYADIAPAIDFSLDRNTVKVKYHVTEGQLVRLGQIRLKGNLRTRDHVLLREITIGKGDPYNPEKIRESQKRLSKIGLFSVLHFDPIQLESDLTIQDVQLTVEERPSVALDFGVGFGNRERFRGFVEVSHRNLWGTSRRVSVRAEGSQVEERYQLNYIEPWFLGKRIDARLVSTYEDLEEVSFDLERFSGALGLDKSFTDRVRGSILYEYELRQTSNVAPTTTLSPEDIGRFVIATVNTSLLRDSRDDPFNPRTGSVNGITLRNAETFLGSEVELVKATLQSRWYFPLGTRMVFAFSARAGVARRLGGTAIIPLSERFFVGGRSTVRGYDEDELGIQNVTIINGEPTGGNAMFVVNEELRIFLPKSFGLVFFFDHGNVWRNLQDVSVSQVKSSTGIGLRYNTPIGPLRFDLGYKLDREGTEGPWVFHFTLGHAF